MENQDSNSGQQTINIQVPSAENIASRRSLIPILFAITIMFFFFNFFTVSCGGQKIESVTGVNLIIGKDIKDSDMFSNRKNGDRVPPNAWAIIAFGAAIIGLGAFLIKDKNEAKIGTGAGIVGVVSLIILQIVMRSTIDQKGEGQLDVSFHFGYWAALIAIGIAGFISYLRLKISPKGVVDALPSTATDAQFSKSVSHPVTPELSNNKANNFEIGKWLIKNKWALIIATTALVVLFCVYYFFIRHDPVKDAEISAIAYCDCSIKSNDVKIKVNEEFIKSFDTYDFKKRQEARSKLQKLQDLEISRNPNCYGAAHEKYNKKRNRYVADKGLLEKFDFAYNTKSATCNPSNQSKLSILIEQIENNIATIKDPEPNIDKIKTDLIGQEIPGWRFDYLNEFRSSEILNTTKGSDRIEFQLKFTLIDIKSGEHECEILAVYLLGYEDWYLDEVRMMYITYTNTAPVNRWNEVRPLTNCRYSIIDQGYKYWAKDGHYGKTYEGGPGASFNLTSSIILISSRESQPVDLIFKYFPNN
jgi:hypothetical protein